MRERIKKTLAFAIAMIMILAMSSAAFAHDISVNNDDTHTYKVFQVLKGTLAKAGDQNLGNPAWGADAVAEPGDVKDFIKSITASGLTEAQIAELVSAKVNTEGDGRGTVDKGHPITGLETGYYVLVDVTELTGDLKDDTRSLHVIKVVNDINGFTVKYDSVPDDKKITGDTLGKDENETANSYNPGVDTDNVSIGDTVNYTLSSKVPARATDYNYFYFIMNDTLDAGLTFTDGSIKVYKESVADANKLTETTDYIVKTGDDADPYTFQIGLKDAKALAGKDIFVTYSAVLNENALIGELSNDNTFKVKFSNNPDDDYDGENHPGFPADDEDGAFGETPEKKTHTYTTGIEIQKVDQDGKVLTGATFELSGKSTKTVLTVAETFTEATGNEAVYWKLKDGKYTKTAPTTTGTYMKPAEAGATSGYVEDSTYTGADKEVVDGKVYRPYAPSTDSGKQIYVKTTGNGHLYESTETKYKKTVTKTANDVKSDHKIAMAVDANGLARFDGLGAGTYTIKETVTPAGYNTLPDLTVTVSFNKGGTPKWSFSGGNGGYDGEEGIYKITIENNKGTQLPSTGGMGTTIFYVIGGLLVLAAAIILISRRRVQQ